MIKVSNIGTATRNNWILETPDGIIAVDTGLPGQSDGFLNRFRKKWPLSTLKYIFLTHAHVDHAGFLAELLDKTEARLILCEESRKILATGLNDEAHEYRNWIGKILEKSMSGATGKYTPVTDTSRMDIVSDNDSLFEKLRFPVRVVFLPGHTKDSTGLYLYENNIIICGDAAMNRPLLNANRHTLMIEDIAEYHRSWERMLSMKIVDIYPGHGKPFKVDELAKYRNYLSVKQTK